MKSLQILALKYEKRGDPIELRGFLCTIRITHVKEKNQNSFLYTNSYSNCLASFVLIMKEVFLFQSIQAAFECKS